MNRVDLKLLAKNRFLVDIIQEVGRKGRGSGTVLVLDEEGSDILTGLMKMPELMENGVFVIENIERQRKTFNKMNAIYFISPTNINIDIIEEDFGGKEKKYNSLHIFFSKKIPDSVFSYLKTKKCVRRIKTLKEANLNVNTLNDFIFLQKNPHDDLDKQCETIFSAISQLPDLQSIELFCLKNPIYKNSAYIQKNLDDRTGELVKATKNGKNTLKVFIFDRKVDLITPLIHDFHYESLTTDVLDDQQHVQKTNDTVYSKYRHAFIKDCILGIGADFEKFLNENPIAKLQRNNKQEPIKTNKLGEVVRGISEFKEIVKDYEYHISNVKKLNKAIEGRGYKELAELECTIVTGVDEYGESTDTKKRLEMASGFLDQLSKDPFNKTRLLMLMQGSLYRDLANKTSSIKEYDLRKKFDKFCEISRKCGKYWPEKEKDNLKKITKKKYKESESSLQRYICKTEYLVKEAIEGNGDKQFDVLKHGSTGFLAKAQNTFFKGKLTNIGKKKSGRVNYVLVYFIGGVSYTEIQYLKNLEKAFGEDTVVVIGSTSVHNPREFIDNYINRGGDKFG